MITPRTGKQILALLVEEDPAIVDRITDLLDQLGYTTAVLSPAMALGSDRLLDDPDLLIVSLEGCAAELPATARLIHARYPRAITVSYAVEFTADLLSEAMTAGLRRVIPYPFSLTTLRQAIDGSREELRQLADQVAVMERPEQVSWRQTPQGAPQPVLPHRLIVITSPKGGVGTSTIAVNLAVALQISGYDTVVVDANLNFTSHSVLLDLVPGRSIADLAGIQDLNHATVLATLSAHPSGLRALLGPEEPEQGDRVLAEDIQAVLGLLQEQFVFTVVDACPCFDGRVLSALEMAHTILVPISPDLPTMKNVNSYLRVIDLLHFDLSKVQLIMVRADSITAREMRDIESAIKRDISLRVVSDGQRTTEAANAGMPFLLSAPESPISQDVLAIARLMIRLASGQGEPIAPKTQGSGRRLFGR